MHIVSGRLRLKVNRGLVLVLSEHLINKGQKFLLLHRLEVGRIVQQDGVLCAVIDEIMARSLFPAVENRLVSPLVILTTEDKCVFLPYQALGQLQPGIRIGLSELKPGNDFPPVFLPLYAVFFFILLSI